MAVLGRYQLDHRLGGGGMAEVFIGQSVGAEGFSRRVAIKRVLAGFSDNPAFAKMFVEEARISSRLQHPNIVSVVDFDRDAEGRLFLVMELVEGKDLDALMSTGLLPVSVAVFVTSEILRGLGYAHDLPVTSGQHDGMRGVVHRDVSPHNVLLSWEGALKVSDFGIAKARSASDATASEFIKGKPAYMSPEQANGERLDGRSDLFAVGIMLWEMLVGRRLFVGEDTRTTLALVLFGNIPRPRSVRSDIPKDLERVVMKLLERDLPARYRTAEEANIDLLDCADAPKAGREALINLLAERFSHEVPFRQARSKPGTSMPPDPRVVANASTIVGHANALQSIGEYRGAQTGTIARRGFGTAAKLGLGLAIVGAGGAATFALTSVLAKGEPAPPVVAAAPIAAPAPPPDAAPVSHDAAPIPLDAAPLETRPATAPKNGGESKPSAEKKYGSLTISAWPTLTASLDGRKLGDTPIIQARVQTGKHKLELTNASGSSETMVIDIKDGKTLTVDRTR